jgi:signal transduction histidine kinase
MRYSAKDSGAGFAGRFQGSDAMTRQQLTATNSCQGNGEEAAIANLQGCGSLDRSGLPLVSSKDDNSEWMLQRCKLGPDLPVFCTTCASLPDCLAELMCLATESDQVIVANTDSEGRVQEQVRCFSHDGAAYSWDDWPDWQELVLRIAQQQIGSGSGKACSAAELGLSLPGALLAFTLDLSRQDRLVFCLLRLPGRPAFTAKEAAILSRLARLWQETSDLDENQLFVQVRLLTQVAQYAGSQKDLQRTLQFALRELSRYLPGTFATIWTLQTAPPARLQLAACGDLLTSASKKRSDSFWLRWQSLPTELALENTALAPVVNERRILYVDNLSAHSSTELQNWGKLGFAVGVALPLLAGSETVGVLVLLSTRTAGFTRVQIQLAHTVADLLGPMIHGLQLTERLRQAYEQLQKLQQQLVNAEKMRALGEMASGMAHDFNNALCGTLGFLELALKDPQLPPHIGEVLRMAHTCALDAASTVRRVQDFTRWDRGLQAAELLLVNDLVRQVVELTRPRWHNAAGASGQSIEVQLDLQAQHPVLANATELREVLTNLIFNAVDAMPQGGRITIATASDAQAVTIRVSDTGLGMSPEVRQRLFEPFFTTKKERGTGLGLSISYAIVKRHGGEITVESEPGRGSTFTIRLPLPREVSVQANRDAFRPVPAVSQTMRVLVVDDEPHVLTFLRQCLLHLGHSPDAFSDAEQALAQLERKHYDLVITDFGMPKLNGQQVAELVSQHNPDIPVILLTGWGEQVQHGKALPSNICHVLAKPITIEQLKQTLLHLQQNRK